MPAVFGQDIQTSSKFAKRFRSNHSSFRGISKVSQLASQITDKDENDIDYRIVEEARQLESFHV